MRCEKICLYLKNRQFPHSRGGLRLFQYRRQNEASWIFRGNHAFIRWVA